MVTSYFDEIFAAVDPQLDNIYGKTFYYRRSGSSIEITATLQAHAIEAKESNGLVGSWHGHHFELASALLVLDGTVFRPEPGDEIAEPRDEGGFDIYQVVQPPGMRCYDLVDVEERKLMVYTEYIRTETE